MIVELKDSERGYWKVETDCRGVTNVDASNDYYETAWSVRATAEAGGPEIQIHFVTTTQHDEPLRLDQVARETLAHIMRFYDAALTRRDV